MARTKPLSRVVRDQDARNGEDQAINALCDHAVLDHKTTVRLIRRAQGGDRSATAAVVTHNIRLMVSIVRRYVSWSGVPLADLIGEGALGMLHAIEKFDHRKGFKFSTYASWWIRHYALRYIQDTARLVRLPVHAQEMLNRLLKAQKRLYVRNGIERPEVDELIAEAALEDVNDLRAKVRELLRHASPGHASLDLKVNDGEGGATSLYGIMPVDGPSPLEEVTKDEADDAVRRAVAKLDPRFRLVIESRFGINGRAERTLHQIGSSDLGVSRERVRQIEAEAKKVLRSLLRDHREA